MKIKIIINRKIISLDYLKMKKIKINFSNLIQLLLIVLLIILGTTKLNAQLKVSKNYSILAQNIGIDSSTPICKYHDKSHDRVDLLTDGDVSDSIINVDLNSILKKISSNRYTSNFNKSNRTVKKSNDSKRTQINAAIIKSVVTASLITNSYTFRANTDVNVTNWTKIKEVGYDTIINPGGFFNASTGVYKAPRSGNYQVNCNLMPEAYISFGGNMEAKIVVNNIARIVTLVVTPSTSISSFFRVTVSGVIILNEGDQVSIRYSSGFGGANRLNHSSNFNTLTITEL